MKILLKLSLLTNHLQASGSILQLWGFLIRNRSGPRPRHIQAADIFRLALPMMCCTSDSSHCSSCFTALNVLYSPGRGSLWGLLSRTHSAPVRDLACLNTMLFVCTLTADCVHRYCQAPTEMLHPHMGCKPKAAVRQLCTLELGWDAKARLRCAHYVLSNCNEDHRALERLLSSCNSNQGEAHRVSCTL